MKPSFTSSDSLSHLSLWTEQKEKNNPISFDLEITARCNNNCAHCYINLPVSDKKSAAAELSPAEIDRIADEAVSLGTVWCLLTGGEPLLRQDFTEIYLSLKRKGLLLSVFTNATLITQQHINLFKKYPPRDIEISVYGVTKEIYERVTRQPGSFEAFMRGVNLLIDNGIKVRFKAMALRSNVKELPQISAFCRTRTKDYFRFDPLLHGRFDLDPARNAEIQSERLSPEEIAAIERADNERLGALQKNCNNLVCHDLEETTCNHLFQCGAGQGSFSISFDGKLRLCSSLWHPDAIYNLRHGSIKEALEKFIPKVRNFRSNNLDFLEKCRKCGLINLCLWCPAHSYLETGRMDTPVDYFCAVAKARAINITSR